MGSLGDGPALQLLKRFAQPSHAGREVEELLSLQQRLVQATGKLPLALEIVGGLLHELADLSLSERQANWQVRSGT